jgi:hypothetical protein
MSYNKTQIIHKALEKLGQGASIGANNKNEKAAENAFDLVYEADIVSSNWDFATKLSVLTRNYEAPLIDKWQYIFELDSDYLKLVELFPSVDYDIIGNKLLYTNASSLSIKYVYLPDPSQLPHYYVKYLINEVAVELAEGVLENASLAERFEIRAAKQLRKASATNAQTKPNAIWKNSRYIGDRY